MDFSEQYFVMCYKSEELQQEFKDKVGPDGIFIPTMDELFDMVKNKNLNDPKATFNYIAMGFYGALEKVHYDSADKYLLAFVMHESYKKKWNQEKLVWETVIKTSNNDNMYKEYDEETKSWKEFEC